MKKLLFALLLPLFPALADAWDGAFAAAGALLKDGRYAKAVEAFRRVEGEAQAFGLRDERHVRALAGLCEALTNQGEAELAEAAGRKAVELAEPGTPAAARALHVLGDALTSRERYDEAEGCLRKALETRAKALGKDHPDTAETRVFLGLAVMNLKRLHEAEGMFREALSALEKAGDLHRASTALNNLAYLHQEQEKHAPAEAEYRRALEMREKCLRADHPDIGMSCSNLATACHAAGKMDEAERLLKRAAGIAEANGGPEDDGLAYALNNLAFLYQSLGRPGEAEPRYRRAIAIWEKTQPGSETLAIALETLAVFLQDNGRQAETDALMARVQSIRARPAESPSAVWRAAFEAGTRALDEMRWAEAVRLLEDALAKARALGEKDERAVLTRGKLALAYRNLPDFPKAEAAARGTLAEAEAQLGPDALEVAEALNTLGLVLDATDRPSEAEPLYQRALGIRVKALGKDHLDVAVTVNNLAFLFMKQRKWEEAEKLFRKASGIAERLKDETYAAFTGNNLGWSLEEQGKAAEAEAEYRKALAVYDRFPGNAYVANVCFNLGNLLRKAGKAAEAEALSKRALQACEGLLGPEHPQTAQALHNLAVLAMAQGGRGDEADGLYRRSRGIWEKAYGPDHPQVAQSLENHARLLESLDRKDEAAEMRRRAESIHAGRR